MDELIIYKDCVEIYGAGAGSYTMEFYADNGDYVQVKKSYNVDVKYSNSDLFGENDMVFGFHRTEEDSKCYAALLEEMFQEWDKIGWVFKFRLTFSSIILIKIGFKTLENSGK